MTVKAARRLVFVFSSLIAYSGAFADSDTVSVDCNRGRSIQEALGKKNADRPLTVLISGTCNEDVTITRDDVTLSGVGAQVNGTISIVGARRVVLRALSVSSPTGNGIFGTGNAAFTVEDSMLERNGTNGVLVRDGAQATLLRNRMAENGTAGLRDSGRGIEATHGAQVDASNNVIANNRSDGIAVLNGSYARLVENTIEGNGRIDAGESGIQVNRARVRAHANVYRNNTGISAVQVVNHSDYRTGTGLNTADFPDNEFSAFELIEHPVGGGRLAVDVSNSSYGDFRQVDITGAIGVGAMSMMQVRGDDVAPNLRCSTITLPPGAGIGVDTRGFLRLRFTRVTPGVPVSPNIQVNNPCTLP